MTQAATVLLYRTPVLGWAVRDLVKGAPDAKYFFIANVVLSLALAIAYFGYPLLITLALGAVAAIFASLLAITSCGVFWGIAQVAREDGRKQSRGGR